MTGDSGAPLSCEPQARPPHAPPTYRFPTTTGGLLPWSHAELQLKSARIFWLATTRPDGRPHVTPLWGASVDGALYLDGLPTTRRARNLAANQSASIHLESGQDVVIIEGIVEEVVVDDGLGTRIVDVWNAKYGRLHPQPSTSGIVRLRPRAAPAWSNESLEDGTSWRFPVR